MADLKLTATYKEYGDEIWFGGDGCGMWIIESDPHNDLTAYLGGLGQTKKGRELMEERARMLAAAPELYEALNRLMNLNHFHLEDCIHEVREAVLSDEDYDGNTWDHPDVTAFSETVEEIKAALAKARGEK